MGKGHRLTFSRSERFLGTHVSGDRHVDAAISAELELMEDDVWSVADRDSERDTCVVWASRAAEAPSWGLKRNGRHVSIGGGDGGGGRRQMAASAPVRVPDWGKISHRVDWGESVGGDSGADVAGGEIVPPHEWAARGRRDGGASVFVGVGRTLKGRDLRRVRDAVWSQTGFDG